MVMIYEVSVTFCTAAAPTFFYCAVRAGRVGGVRLALTLRPDTDLLIQLHTTIQGEECPKDVLTYTNVECLIVTGNKTSNRNHF